LAANRHQAAAGHRSIYEAWRGGPLVYFDIVGAYGTMNGRRLELATASSSKGGGATKVKFISSGRPALHRERAANLRNGLDAALRCWRAGRQRHQRLRPRN